MDGKLIVLQIINAAVIHSIFDGFAYTLPPSFHITDDLNQVLLATHYAHGLRSDGTWPGSTRPAPIADPLRGPQPA